MASIIGYGSGRPNCFFIKHCVYSSDLYNKPWLLSMKEICLCDIVDMSVHAMLHVFILLGIT